MPFKLAVRKAEELAREKFGSRLNRVEQSSVKETGGGRIRRAELHFDSNIPLHEMNELEAAIRRSFPFEKGGETLRAIPKAKIDRRGGAYAVELPRFDDGVSIAVGYHPNRITLTHFPDREAVRTKVVRGKVAQWLSGKRKRGRAGN